VLSLPFLYLQFLFGKKTEILLLEVQYLLQHKVKN